MIKLAKVVKRYGEHEVLGGVSLQITAGEVCVLVGASGGGKSTLLRTINGLETFQSGTIHVDGIELGPERATGRDQALTQIRRRVGMVFQQFHLFPHRNVLENVIEAPMHVLGQSKAEATETAHQLLQRVGMEHKLRARPLELSGGQQQRVAIARALAMKPQVILFDEPTSALDPAMTLEVTRVISDLAASGQTMVIVTHAMEFARQVAHRVHYLDRGQIAKSGTAAEILDH